MRAEGQAGPRLEGLDALRGLAALVVVFSHTLHILPQFGTRPWHGPETWLTATLKHTPLFTLVDGHAAVMLFFVLSGLVLGRQMLSPRAPGYVVFAAKRFARLYPPYAAALLLSAALQWGLGVAAPHGPSAWLADNWTDAPSPQVVLDYALMLGNSVALDNPVWSLDYEMRLSLLFPLLLLPLRRGFPRLAMVCALALLFGGEALAQQGPGGLSLLAGRTACYAGMFLGGAVLGTLASRLGQARGLAAPLALLAWAVLWLNWRDSLMALGAGLLIAASLLPGPLARLCATGFARFLGRISYSLYLVHVPVLMALLAATAGWLPQGAAMVLVPPAAVLAGWVFYRLVELPSHGRARAIGR